MTKTIVAMLLAVVAPSNVALGADRGTPAEAKAMLQKAAEHYKAAGRKQALADFNAKKAPFGDGDLYVFCMGPDRVVVANGGFPSFVGRSGDEIKDVDGKSVGKAAWDLASSKGEGSVQYRWLNPLTGKMEPKISFVQRVGDDVCGVGAYNPPR
jgi:signal transduction histidine kinase